MSPVATPLVVGTEHLGNALARIAHLSPKNHAIEVLGHTLVEWTDDGLRLTTTDLDSRASVFVACEGGEGAVCVPTDVLYGLLTKAPKGDARIEIDGAVMRLRAGGSYELRGIVASDFPTWAEVGGDEWTIPAEALKDALSFVGWCAYKDVSQPILHGVYLDRVNGAVVATNRHILAAVGTPAIGEGAACPLLAGESVKQIERFLADGEVRVVATERALTIHDDDASFSTRLTDGTYPNWLQIVPHEPFAFVAQIDRAELAAAVGRASLYVGTDLNADMRLTWTDGVLRVQSTENDKGGSDDPVAGEAEGDFGIRFNTRYVATVLSKLTGETVRFRAQAPERATLWDGDQADRYYLVMPKRDF